MPPAAASKPVRVCAGSGMTAGLELWRIPETGQLVLVDQSPDGRFATDTATWNAHLNTATRKRLKDATKQNAAPTHAEHTGP